MGWVVGQQFSRFLTNGNPCFSGSAADCDVGGEQEAEEGFVHHQQRRTTDHLTSYMRHQDMSQLCIKKLYILMATVHYWHWDVHWKYQCNSKRCKNTALDFCSVENTLNSNNQTSHFNWEMHLCAPCVPLLKQVFFNGHKTNEPPLV